MIYDTQKYKYFTHERKFQKGGREAFTKMKTLKGVKMEFLEG